MKTLDEIKTTLQNLLPELRDRYSIVFLGIFGSYARGEQTPDSDVDILVEFDSSARFGLFKFCDLENTLSDQLEIKVDLVEKSALKPYIGKHILQEVLPL